MKNILIERVYLILKQWKIKKEQVDFNSKDYWEQRYKRNGNSGAGSYNRLAEFKAEVINDFINRRHIQGIVEWGCGDGNQLKLMEYQQYVGYDVSKTTINHCKEIFADDQKKEFIWYDGGNEKVTRPYELALSLDVIYHLVEDSVFQVYMSNLFSSSYKYVCIYASNYNQRHATHVRHRKFTSYIEKYYPEWKLIKYTKNRYPIDKKNPEDPTTSFADFYFYKKVRSEV